jgi:hypothetical protein
MEAEPITKARIDELLQFLPLFDRPDRAFVEPWGGGQPTESGAIQMPYPVYPDDVRRFFELAAQPCWSDYGYKPSEAGDLAHEAFIRQATLDEIKTILTYCVRGERFSDGHWGSMLASGVIMAILKRLKHLRDDVPS